MYTVYVYVLSLFQGTLSVVGILNVGLSILVSYGLCSAAGLFYGPMHSSLPFLLLGLGIDDMFVIVQSFDNLKAESRDIPELVGATMRRAGVAITVTSLTDVLVFVVGSTTVLPALRCVVIIQLWNNFKVYLIVLMYFTYF